MKKTKTQKGITLVALIITIVVLLILAVVAIDSIQNDGILSYAQNAVKDYEQAQKDEQAMLDEYLNYMPGNSQKYEEVTLSYAQTDTMLTKTTNSVTIDEYGNKIVVPAGFKITTDATNVTQGMVIEDKDGNQFVWIPVGKIYTNVENTTYETVTLGRYEWAAGQSGYVETPLATLKQPTVENPYTAEVTISGTGETSVEYQKDTVTTFGNERARDISEFYLNSSKNGGYYIGRYEAGNSNNTLVCKAGQTVYSTTQATASELSKNMYGYNAGTFASDLLNSYAWDTALVFIQTFGISDYSCKMYTSKSGYTIQATGTNVFNETNAEDRQLNIYDIAGNAGEWSTETATSWQNGYSRMFRGSQFASLYCSAGETDSQGFRPVLYIL